MAPCQTYPNSNANNVTSIVIVFSTDQCCTTFNFILPCVLQQEVLDNHEFAKSTLIDYGNWTGQSALHKACKSGFAE